MVRDDIIICNNLSYSDSPRGISSRSFTSPWQEKPFNSISNMDTFSIITSHRSSSLCNKSRIAVNLTKSVIHDLLCF